jgi:hypothetical protein
VFHKGPLTANQRVAFDWLPKEGSKPAMPVNINARDVDVSGSLDSSTARLWAAQHNPELPWVVVEFPPQDRVAGPAWSGKLDLETLKNLVDSPARHEVARRLLRGDCAVWILVETGDAKSAQTISTAVEAELRKLETTLKLPAPARGAEELEYKPSPMSLKVPLRIGFSTLHVRADDPAERMLVQILRQTSRHPVPVDSPVVAYPVFGRGRCLGGHAGESLAPEAIARECSFITGACSCVAKSMNPGVDLPMLAKWDDFVSGTVGVSVALPPLTGLMPVAPVAAQSGTTAPAPKQVQTPPPPAQTPAALKTVGLMGSVFTALGIGVVFVAGAVFVISRRGR